MANNFNQGMIQLSLTGELKSILQQYPDDNQILKELIQNAEDAGARVVKFLYDKTQYGTDPDKLHCEELAEYQGPALYAYNDAEFSDDDWTSVRMLQDSLKKDDPMKVGRFGLGFKSVFHMTDLPGILSGNQVGFLDPHESFFTYRTPEGRSRRTSSHAWKLDEADLPRIPHQYEPFKQGLFGTEEQYRTHFPGTIFRFPLRQKQNTSEISKTEYTEEKIKLLFEMFEFEAHSFLLFLNHIEKIEVYEKKSAKAIPQLVMSISIDDVCLGEIRDKREKFQNSVFAGGGASARVWRNSPVNSTYGMRTKLRKRNGSSETKSWLVTQYFEGGTNSSLKRLMESGFAKMLPWVGIALPLDGANLQRPGGQVFCFLPLPAEENSATGFHFHVNGYFAVDQNRRHLKWPSADQQTSRHTDQAREWNMAMLREAIPKALKALVLYSIQCGHSCRDVYRLFPEPIRVLSHWKALIEPFYLAIEEESIYFTEESGGQWVSAHEACVVSEEELHKNLISKVLLQSTRDSNFVRPEAFVLESMPSVEPRQVDAAFLQQFVASFDTTHLSRQERRGLVEYFARTHAGIELLKSLKLCQLENGTLVDFSETCYIDSGDCRSAMTELFPGLKYRFHEKVWDTDRNFHSVLVRIAESGKTRLVLVRNNAIPDLLRKMFREYPDSVHLNSNLRYEGTWFQVTEKWYNAVWEQMRCSSFPLYTFEGIPLLKSDNTLYGLRRDMPFIPVQRGSTRLSEEMRHILKKIGLILLTHLHISDSLPEEYVPRPDPAGVLRGIQKIPNYVAMVSTHLDAPERRKLRRFLSDVTDTTHQALAVLRTLPIFETLPTIWAASQWLSAQSTKIGYRSTPCVPPNGTLLDLREEWDQRLAGILGIQMVSEQEFYRTYVLPSLDSYTDEQKHTLMLRILNNLDGLGGRNGNIASTLKQLSCIPTSLKTYARPGETFDPKDNVIKNMFVDSNLLPFPAIQHQSDVTLSTMRMLGMGGASDINARQIYQLAVYIDKRIGRHDSSTGRWQQGKHLADFLNKQPQLLATTIEVRQTYKNLRDALWKLKFIPPKEERPANYGNDLPWFKSQYNLVSPAEISTRYALVGSQQPTADIHLKTLEKAFGWHEDPDLSKVIHHLGEIIESYQPGATMPEVLFKIYQFLDAQVTEYTVPDVNELGKWVWCRNEYVAPNDVVLSSSLPIDAKPYIYVCEPNMKVFENLLRMAGVRERIDSTEILQRIKEAHEIETKTQAVIRRDHAIVMTIIRQIRDALETDKTLQVPEGLLIPVRTRDGRLRLTPVEDCTFCDSEWLKRGWDEDDVDDLGEEVHIVHSDISQAIAKTLAVPSFMSRYLNAEELDMSYGQSEPLTRRIHTILDDYKDGSAVLKELIQNADDAGASEIAFVHDRRDFTSQSRSLLGENMRSLQGPAVWSYNDAVFTDADFDNIVKLSGATKEEETTKIGRFGLGFNAVYHLTDVPSFMSRENIVLFDPHTTYLGHSIRNPLKPGIKLNIVSHASRIKKFEDQFKPFFGMFGADLKQSFNGTLFRFPLRTPEQARNSDISGKVYSEQEVTSLFRILYDEADALLMFTQNVRKLTVYTISDDVREMPKLEESFKIERKVVTVLKEMIPRLHEGVPEREPRILHAAKAIQEQSDECSDVCHSGGYIIDIQVSDFSREGNQNQTRFCYWVVYGAVGVGKAAELSRKNKKLLPVGGVAGKLGYRDATKKYILEPLPEGKVFCFLPLPIRNELPVHTNGYFAITTSRTHLHGNEKTEKVDERALWNSALMGDAVCLAYTEMLCAISGSSLFDQDHILKNIFDFFPTGIAKTTEGRSNAIFTLMEMFLGRVFTESSVDLLPTSDNWTNASNFKALDRYVRESEICQVFTTVCQSIATQCATPFAFVDMPLSIYNDLERCELIDDVSHNLFTYQELYDDVILPNIVLLHPDDAEQIIFHSLTMVNNTLDGSLRSAKCIPVGRREQKVYQYAKRLVDPLSDLKGLFREDEGYFPSALLQETSSVQREQWRTGLKRLGMSDEYLEADEVLERAYSITGLDPDAAASRAQCLIHLLSRMHRNQKEVNAEELRTIHFIPKKEKPADWILPWVGDNSSDLLSMDDIYTGRDCTFLGSVLPVPEMSTNSLSYFGGLLRELNVVKEIQLVHVERQIAVVEEYLGNGSDNKKEVGNKIAGVMRSCYYWCDEYAGKNGEVLRDRFADTPFVFVAGTQPTLVAPSKCAKQVKTDCSPYLNKLPSDFYYFKLTKALQIPEQFEPNHYIEVLRKCAEEHGKNKVPSNVAQPILHTIQGLAECIEEYGHNRVTSYLAELGTIYLLNDEGRFLPSTELSINVFDWIPDADQSKMCHSKISPANARTLGVKTNRESVLDNYALGVSFGQHEELTNRIKRILEGYPCDKEILKELLQNADDAEATEIHFVLDERQHKTEKLFSESWKHLQGPALLVFNDKPFSQRDLEGIQRLGEGSKADDAITTGKYGVGFNCVYHLTDTPTFLSRGKEIDEKLCAFDPQCKFVPQSDRFNPGRMYNVDERLRSSFTDVFECYDFPEFNRPESTLFRLPLRSRFVARDSVFSESPMTTEHISSLFTRLQEEMSIALLFLSNVRKISLSKVDTSGRLRTAFVADAELGEEASKKKKAYDAAVTNAATALKRRETSIERVPVTEAVYGVSVKTSDEFTEQWLVCQRIGFGDRADIPAGLVQQYAQAKAALLPRGGVAFSLGAKKRKKQTDTPSQEDAARSSMFSYQEKDSRAHIKPKLFCFLPLPQESCLPMHVNGHFILDSENRHDIFHSEDCNAFRNKWNQCLLGSVVAETYLSLLFEMKNRLPNGVLPYHKVRKRLSVYMDMFPHTDLKYIRSELRNVQSSIYDLMTVHNSPLLPVLERQQIAAEASQLQNNEKVVLKWKGVEDGVFFDDLSKQLPAPTYGFSPVPPATTAPSPGMILKNVLLNCKFPFTAFPFRLVYRLSECSNSQEPEVALAPSTAISKMPANSARDKVCEQKSGCKQTLMHKLVVSPEAVLTYLQQYKHNGSSFGLPAFLTQTPFLSPDAVKITFDYVRKAKSFTKSLEGLPLLLTHDGILREFKAGTTPVLASSYTSLIPELPHRFLHLVFDASTFVQQEVRAAISAYIKDMDVTDLAAMLNEHLPQEQFFNQDRAPLPDERFMAWLAHCYDFLHRQSFTTDSMGRSQFNPQTLAPLGDWCLVPTSSCCERYLTRVRDAKLLLSPARVQDALKKLPLPRVCLPDDPRLSASMAKVLQRITANVENPYFLLQALVENLSKIPNISDLVTAQTARDVLVLFNGYLSDLKSAPLSRKMLKSLPLHVTATKSIVRVDRTRYVGIIPKDVPSKGVDKMYCNDVVFLERSYSLQALHAFLGFDSPTFEACYQNHIFSVFHLMDDKEIEEHLRIIKQHTEQHRKLTDGLQRLLLKLESVKFMPKADSTRHLVEEFYDPAVRLFRVMHNKKDFPQSPYDGEEWRPFLRKIGLVSKATQAMCVKYAQEIASGKHDSNICSQELVHHIFYETEESESHLRAVQDIAFLPRRDTPETLSKIAEPFTKPKLVSYRMSMSSQHEPVCWTVLPVVPVWAVPFAKQIKLLQVPTSQHVIQHLKNIYTQRRSTLARETLAFIRAVQKKVIECLEYIEENGLTQAELKQLSAVAIVVSDSGTFYAANQVVVTLEKEWETIQPILCRLPPMFGSREDFLKKLGLTNEITLEQATWVLKEIYEASKGAKLLPNQLLSVVSATKILFISLEKMIDCAELTELYLPSREGSMHSAADMYFADTPDILDRNFQLGVTVLHPLHTPVGETRIITVEAQKEGIMKLPLPVRPKCLSSRFTKVLDSDCQHGVTTSDAVDSLKEKLAANVFFHCILRLLKHGSKESENDYMDLMDQIEDALSGVECIALHKIKTCYMQNGEKVGGSDKSGRYFISQSNEQPNNLKIYVSAKTKTNEIIICWRISEALLKIPFFKNLKSSSLSKHLDLLLTKDLRDMEDALDELDISAYGNAHDVSPAIPEPGDLVPQIYFGMLEQHISRLRIGEYVAYQTEDPLLDSDHPVDTDVERTFIYAKVIEIILPEEDETEASPVDYKYKIDIGQKKPIVVISVLLYRLKEHKREVEEGKEGEVSSGDLQVYEGAGCNGAPAGDSTPPGGVRNAADDDDSTEPETLEEIKEYITNRLISASRLGKKERRAVFLRLAMQFHPDKNPHRVDIATEAFKFLKNQYNVLEQGGDLRAGNGEQYRGSADNWFERNFNNFRSRARRDKRREEDFTGYDFENFYRSDRPRNRERNRNRNQSYRPNPQPGVARRWLRQAGYDIEAVSNDADQHSYEWACYKCHQAAEKAARAAQYKVDASADRPSYDTLVACACYELTSQLRQLIGPSDGMQYPNSFSQFGVPHDRYTCEMASQAADIASKIVENCVRFINT